jgi:hypothetical protein
MFGCLRRLGCLALVLLAGALLYLNRGAWLPQLRAVVGNDAPAADSGAAPAAVADGRWQPLTPAGAARARTGVQSLSARSGPVYVNLAAADLAAYIYDELRRQLPASAEGVEATVIGDQLHVRAVVRLSDLGGTQVLGPLAQFLGERDTVQFGGTIGVVRPGLAEYRLRQIRLRQLAIPAPLIPQIVRQLGTGNRPEGVAADALPLAVPAYVSDVRIGRGRVTLYKAVP